MLAIIASANGSQSLVLCYRGDEKAEFEENGDRVEVITCENEGVLDFLESTGGLDNNVLPRIEDFLMEIYKRGIADGKKQVAMQAAAKITELLSSQKGGEEMELIPGFTQEEMEIIEDLKLIELLDECFVR